MIQYHPGGFGRVVRGAIGNTNQTVLRPDHCKISVDGQEGYEGTLMKSDTLLRDGNDLSVANLS